MLVVLNLALFVALIAGFAVVSLQGWTLGRRVLAALVAGAAFGLGLQLIHGIDSAVITQTLIWTNVVGEGYVNLLKMIVTPLVLVSMVAAVVKLDEIATLGKVGGLVVGLLVGTTAIAALVGVLMASSFGLTATGLVEGEREVAKIADLESRQDRLGAMTPADMIVSFIPSNIVEDLAGLRSTSIIAVVIFGILLGIAGLLVTRENPEQGKAFRHFVDVAQTVVLKLARLIIGLTPFGVLALMTKVTATSSGSDIVNLAGFVLASYLAIAIMFGVHAAMLIANGTNVLDYFRRIWPVLAFAFTSRSSAATIPLNVETQTRALGNDPAVANVSATFGATIGQNGCAGIYPAMLAVMVAPTVGVDPMSVSFIATLIVVIAISSFGVAGIGGGATFAALMVLPAMGLPVTLVALLISIEPLIDMARTALNVNGAMTAGTLTAKWLGLQSVPTESVRSD